MCHGTVTDVRGECAAVKFATSPRWYYWDELIEKPVVLDPVKRALRTQHTRPNYAPTPTKKKGEKLEKKAAKKVHHKKHPAVK